ncbi:hypothetical protein BJ508DRAFT_310265 [Ascobolus immersus RN42]|uniref:Uncharacterized protein n=1 Tax=Ascobolus immersus RN42 TaxID=1160509 RepID=A0A3N4HTX1_ASCIM|nr:hypothetical protein BJ508DRAFT_310265 [Ascobolus immersus RN42]
MTDAPPSPAHSSSTNSATRLLTNIKRRSTTANTPVSPKGPKVPVRTTSISSPIPYHGPGGYSDPHRRHENGGRRVVSGSSINSHAPALNPKRRSRFIEEDDGSAIQSSGGGGTVNGNGNGGINYAADANSMRSRWSGTNMGSASSRWSHNGVEQGVWGPAVDLRDAVSPDNPPIGFDRNAWKEYIVAIERRREEQVELMRKTLRTQEEIRAAKAPPPVSGPRITELDSASSPSSPASPRSSLPPPPQPTLSPFPPQQDYRIIAPPLPLNPPHRANTLPTSLTQPPPIRKRTSSLRHTFGSILSTLSPTPSNADQQTPSRSRPSSRMDSLNLRLSSPARSTSTASNLDKEKDKDRSESFTKAVRRRASMTLSVFSFSTKAEEEEDAPIEQPRKLTKAKPARSRSHTQSSSISFSTAPTPFDLLSREEQERITKGRRHSGGGMSALGMGNTSVVSSMGQNGYMENEEAQSKRGLETLEEGKEQEEFNADAVGWKRRRVREGWRKVGRRISGVLRIKSEA